MIKGPTKEGQDKRRTREGREEDKRRTRGGQEKDKRRTREGREENKRRTKGGHRARGQRTTAGQDKDKGSTRGGQEKHKGRTREGQDPDTVRGVARESGQFFPRENPNSKLFGDSKLTMKELPSNPKIKGPDNPTYESLRILSF